MYDLGSTHGTLVNKTKIQPRCYYRLRVGQSARFGGSSRLFVLQVHVCFTELWLQSSLSKARITKLSG